MERVTKRILGFFLAYIVFSAIGLAALAAIIGAASFVSWRAPEIGYHTLLLGRLVLVSVIFPSFFYACSDEVLR